MIRLESIEDEAKGYVTYELKGGQRIKMDAREVHLHGAVAILRRAGYDVEGDVRLPVFQDERRVGTLPGDFDPMFAKTRSFMYEVRRGDFRREADRWVACPTLGPRDLDVLIGFERDEVKS